MEEVVVSGFISFRILHGRQRTYGKAKSLRRDEIGGNFALLSTESKEIMFCMNCSRETLTVDFAQTLHVMDEQNNYII